MPERYSLPKEIDNYLNFIYAVARQNQVDLLTNEKGKKAVNELGELCNDAIDYMSEFAKNPDETGPTPKYAIVAFTFQILMPQSSAMYSNLLLGNALTCFSQLELLIRSFAVSYGADAKFQKAGTAADKLGELRQKDGRHINTEKRLKDLDYSAWELWTQLCDDWTRLKGITDKPVKEIVEKPGIPVWALSSPVVYSLSELENLDALSARVAAFRSLLKLGMDKWKRDALKAMA